MLRRRTAAAVLVFGLVALGLTGCQTAKAGQRCRGNGYAQDRTYVLQCKKGRWVRTITKAAAQRALANYLIAHATTTAPPVETIPAPEPPPTTPSTIQVVYAVPADVTASSTIGAAISNEIPAVNAWFAAQHGGTGLSFATEGGLLSIRTVALAETTAQLTAMGEASAYSAVEVEIGDAVERATFALLVYIDAGTADFACGRTAIRSDASTTTISSILWMSACNIHPSATSAWPYGATYLAGHELTHALGAVPSCAPHEGVSGHITDDPRDVLYWGSSPRDWLNLQLDPGHDDYYLTGRSDCLDIASSALWAH